MKSKTLIVVVCLLVLLGGAGVLLLARRHTSSAAAGSQASPSQQTGSTQSAPTQWTATAPLVFDSLNDFPVKGLPPSAPVPPGSPDQVAMILAWKISKGGDDSLPSLLTALQAAGFTIMDGNGKVLRTASGDGKGTGLVIFDWEAVGMLKLLKRGIGIKLDTLTTSMVQDTKKFPASKLSDMLLQDLRFHADDFDDPFGRFWARLIIELSKYSAKPVDLMTAAASDVNLNMIQESLWMRRLTGIFYAIKKGTKQQSNRDRAPLSHGTFANAGFRKEEGSRLSLASLAQEGNLPCQLSEQESLTLDARSYIGTIIHDKGFEVMKEFFEHGHIEVGAEFMEALSHRILIANIALGWLKLVAALTMIEGKIEMAGAGPLVRTFNSTEGEQRLMTATLREEVGQKQMLNCFRLQIIAYTGLDYSMPTDGPLAEKAVEWHFAGDNEIRVNNASTQNLEHFVFFKAPESDPGEAEHEERNADPQKQKTNKEGVTKMLLVGSPKIPVVIESTSMKVEKQADVLVGITLKSSQDVQQNVIDILGLGAGVALGGPTGLLLIPAELAYRLPYVAARATFPVTDHEPCDGQMVGTVNYSVIEDSSFSRGVEPRTGEFDTTTGGSDNMSRTLHFTGTVTVRGKDSEEDASASVIYQHNLVVSGKHLCSRIKGLEASSTTSSETQFGSGSGSGVGNLGLSLDKDEYRISFHPRSVSIDGQFISQSSTNSCAHLKPQSNSASSSVDFGVSGDLKATQKYGNDRNVLSGSSTTSETHSAGGITVTVTATISWNLRMCSR